MTHSNKNFVLAYLVLVALPVLGLVGVLRSGRNLVAPESVGGSWKIQADSTKLAALPCGVPLATGSDAGFTISQSGKNFTMNFTNSPMSVSSGEIQELSVKATILPSAGWAKTPGCGNGRALSLIATLDPKASPPSLAGTLSVNDCPTCVSVDFRAVQMDQAKAKGGR